MLNDAESYQTLVNNFSWKIPRQFNLGVDVCDKWARKDPSRVAIEHCHSNGVVNSYTFEDLKVQSNKLANLLIDRGAEPGDRVGILLPQQPETAISHIAVLKMGAISMPLFTLFKEDALEYRLIDSGAKFLITDQEGLEKVAKIRDKLPNLKFIFSTDGTNNDALNLLELLEGQPEKFNPVPTKADDPALITYTSGTTGNPKGALHAHRVLLGHLPGVEMSHDLLPREGDKFWTPADWAWVGGLLDVLMPALHHGIPVVSCRFSKFDGEAAFSLLAKQKIRNVFLPPTALKIMRQVENPNKRWNYSLRSIASGGESLGSELIDWGKKTFGVTINEFYGQTECNMIVSSCNAVMESKPGYMGRSVPGHNVSIVDDHGNPLPNGTQGNIAVQGPDPVMFLEYWKNPQATREKFVGNLLLTGDTGVCEDDGWIKFVGRNDDVITSSGYRIGPGEIENCLLQHASVAMAGVVGKPDQMRTEIVKAYVVLNKGIVADEKLETELREFVKNNLAAYEYPREIEFVDSLPLTTTGKVVRRKLREMAISELK